MNTETTMLAERLGMRLRPAPAQEAVQAPSTPAHAAPRPAVLTTMVGQERARTQLLMAIRGAQQRDEACPHVLFHGPAGTGKTSLAEIVGHETGGALVRATASALGSPKNLARALVKLEAGSVFFIDEVHGLSKLSTELLYTALEDGRVEFIAGAGTKSEVVSAELEPFTLVAATTELGRVPQPLRDRMRVIELEHYRDDELAEIVTRAAGDTPISPDAADDLGRRSRGTPRIALDLLGRVRDYAAVMGDGKITDEMVQGCMKVMEIDEQGLTLTDQMVLLALVDDGPGGFKGGPVGLDNLAVAAGQDPSTVKSVVEPHLIRIGFMARLPRGRVATRRAYEHLGMRAPADLGW